MRRKKNQPVPRLITSSRETPATINITCIISPPPLVRPGVDVPLVLPIVVGGALVAVASGVCVEITAVVVAVAVGDAPAVAVAPAVGDAPGGVVGFGVGVCVGAFVGVGVGVGVFVGVGVGVGVSVGVGEGVEVSVGVAIGAVALFA
jgi:hypothetical protein